MNFCEGFVHRFLKFLSISYPDQLGINQIADKINLSVKFWDETSEAVRYKGKKMIFINETLNEQQQWQEFGHELFHVFGHTGKQNQMNKTFWQLQESQANYFAYHFCVPTFMLEQLKGVDVYDIMNLFNVEYEFAYQRLEMLKNQFYAKIL